MKKRIILIILWCLVLSVAAMIFFFSSQSGDESSQTSTGFTNLLLHLLRPDYDALPGREKALLFRQFHGIVRKAAHFTEFAMLGFFLRLLLAALKTRHGFWLTWGISTLYAGVDEIHQMLVSARAGMWQDVCIDSAGALAGTVIAILLLRLYRKWKKSKSR